MTDARLASQTTSAQVSPDTRPDVPPEAQPGTRLDWVDVCRGITVLLVVMHHVSGSARSHIPDGSALWLAVLTLNRLTQAVVPTFLLLSALVFARSSQALVSWSSWRSYLGSRGRQLLWPYVVWTALYLGFKGATGAGPAPGDWLATFLGAGLLQGNGYFHLYYLLLALQAVALLPLLRLQNRFRLRLGWVALGAGLLQLGVYLLNLRLWHLNNVGSLLLWYLPPLLLGMALGAWPGRFEGLWARHRRLLLAACALALAAYLPLGFAEVRGTLRSAFAYSAGNWAYTALAALVLGGLSVDLARLEGRRSFGGRLSIGGGPNLGVWLSGRVSAAFRRLGRLSLQIYLLHPAVLWALGELIFPTAALAQVLTGVLYTALAVGLPLLLTRIIRGRSASVWLFGR